MKIFPNCVIVWTSAKAVNVYHAEYDVTYWTPFKELAEGSIREKGDKGDLVTTSTWWLAQFKWQLLALRQGRHHFYGTRFYDLDRNMRLAALIKRIGPEIVEELLREIERTQADVREYL